MGAPARRRSWASYRQPDPDDDDLDVGLIDVPRTILMLKGLGEAKTGRRSGTERRLLIEAATALAHLQAMADSPCGARRAAPAARMAPMTLEDARARHAALQRLLAAYPTSWPAMQAARIERAELERAFPKLAIVGG